MQESAFFYTTGLINVSTVSLMKYCTSYKKALNRVYRFMRCFCPTWPFFFHLFFHPFPSALGWSYLNMC